MKKVYRVIKHKNYVCETNSNMIAFIVLNKKTGKLQHKPIVDINKTNPNYYLIDLGISVIFDKYNYELVKCLLISDNDNKKYCEIVYETGTFKMHSLFEELT